TPSDREVAVLRSFRAPRDRVFAAYTQPDLVRRWMLGPPGWTMPVCEMDVRVGGSYRWRWRSEAEGAEFGFHGTFEVVDPPSRLRHLESFDPGDVGGSMAEAGTATVTTTFEEHDGVTTVTTLIEYASKEERDAAVATGMTDGMEMSYALLDTLLADAAPA
ncbi:MAG: SRPBCC family protein, partial [Myxococcales bacterium]|nr:SRPBCC family protein [Myxococcales bacterium]